MQEVTTGLLAIYEYFFSDFGSSSRHWPRSYFLFNPVASHDPGDGVAEQAGDATEYPFVTLSLHKLRKVHGECDLGPKGLIGYWTRKCYPLCKRWPGEVISSFKGRLLDHGTAATCSVE